jgi:cytoplasmic iron level regulating protein YaaA (DUF328/UPF0246 family)
MKIIISPAKSLDFERPLPTSQHTKPTLLKKSYEVITVLREKSPAQLKSLMDLSDKLAQLNWERNQHFSGATSITDSSRPAIYAFNGDVYAGLDAYTINQDKIFDLQDKVRILSGLYGMLKPLDVIEPYRLEMGTLLSVGGKKNLYDFWKEDITDLLNSEFNKQDFLVNLASKEYADVIDMKSIKVPIITPEFKDYKNGKLSVISFFAKKARGLMARYIIDNNAGSLDDLKRFNLEGYAFDEQLSAGNKLVFTR